MQNYPIGGEVQKGATCRIICGGLRVFRVCHRGIRYGRRSPGVRRPFIREGTMKENTALEQVGSGADRLDFFFTRRGFVKVSGAFVASMVALGLLPVLRRCGSHELEGQGRLLCDPRSRAQGESRSLHGLPALRDELHASERRRVPARCCAHPRARWLSVRCGLRHQRWHLLLL